MKNEQYTALLKEMYPGIDIVPVEKYISPQATIRHECKSCGMHWFDKPYNLINKADTILGHVCNDSIFNRIGNNGYTTHSKHSFKHSEETDKLANAVLLVEVGYSIEEVAEYLEIKPTVLLRWVNHVGIVPKNKLKRNSEVKTTKQIEDYNTRKKRQEIREMLKLAREVSWLLENKVKKEAENTTEDNTSNS
ncbi:hypothetical protein [Priestia aryabhattai]|uniref:hypothetical protein n=1 Tax=Priestia aryabhattai TaxID=412384 RepID=UPI001ADA9881|nr:hypothetical protein [Priestia aryabhattai]QTL49968.1 hypothetical protein J5Z55_02300 [Priestia aryabhattai]